MHKDLPEWLKTLIICGREDDDEGEDEPDEDADADDDGEDDDPDDDKGRNDELEAVKKALRAERKLRKAKERENRDLKRKKQADLDDEDVDERVRVAEERSTRLAKGFLDNQIDAAIEREARRQGFIDPTDALIDSIRRAVDSDQDEDDPTDIAIDLRTVKTAVRDYARKKPHLVGKEKDSGETEEEDKAPRNRSGGKFRKQREKDGEKDLTNFYPSLQ